MSVVALIDMDGVLADFDPKLFEVVATNGWVMDCKPHTQKYRYATDHVIHPGERKAARKLTQSEGWFRELPVIEGAVEGINELAARADVWICTKHMRSNPFCHSEKAAWVVEHLGRTWLDRLIITADKSMVRGDILLDDAPKIDWLPRASWTPIIYPTCWNGEGSEWAGIPRWDWSTPIDVLFDLRKHRLLSKHQALK